MLERPFTVREHRILVTANGAISRVSRAIRATVALIFAGALFWGMCSCGKVETEKSVLEVGSRKIGAEQLQKDIKYLSSGMGLPAGGNQLINDRLLDRIIEHCLIEQYAEKNNIIVSDEELNLAIQNIRKDYPDDAFEKMLLETYTDFNEWKRHLRDQLLSRKVFDKVTKRVPLPGLAEIKNYYDTHLDQYTISDQVKFRQIVTESRQKAQMILRRIKQGESFEALAREFSIAPEATEGGLVGWIAKGTLDPSMDKVLFSLPAGQISPVVKTPYGYHIFEVIELRREGVRPLKEVMDEIESRLYSQKREQFYNDWIKKLRSETKVRFDKELFREMEGNNA